MDICLITEILLKTAASPKISLKSGNRLQIYGQKRLKWRAAAILNFTNVHLMAISRFANDIADTSDLEFLNFRVYVM